MHLWRAQTLQGDHHLRVHRERVRLRAVGAAGFRSAVASRIVKAGAELFAPLLTPLQCQRRGAHHQHAPGPVARSIISWITSPVSIVLPARHRQRSTGFTRGITIANASGSGWYSLMRTRDSRRVGR